MASAMNLVFLVTKILSLMVLFQSSNQASTADFSSLLARLYKKAADSNRPLFIIFSNEEQTNRQIKKPNKIFDLLGKELDLGHHHVAYDNLDKKKNYRPKVGPRRPKKSKPLGNQFSALLQDKKKSRNDQAVLRSPVLKSLLRISNNIRCVARNECEDECSGKYVSPKKQDNCKNECEEQFECEEEEKNSCEESDDECGETTGSTKGWAVTDAWNGCPEC